jgi:hypothetical protein
VSPMLRYSRLLLVSINGSVRELESTSASTAFVKLPVMTAVEGARGHQTVRISGRSGDDEPA